MPPFGATSDRLFAACLQALRLRYEALTSVVTSHDQTRDSPRIRFSTIPHYYTPHMFRRPDILMMAGRILLNPPAITDEAAINLLVLRRQLELPSDITDQTLFNLIALFRKEIPSSHSLEATPTLSNFPFLDDLPVVENTSVQKRS